MANIVIIGGSRGLGYALAHALPEESDTVWIVSRTKPEIMPENSHWVCTDLALKDAAQTISLALAKTPISLLIYSAGIWEGNSFEEEPPETLANILQVNLTQAVLTIQALLPQLRSAPHAKIILIGSVVGLENKGTQDIAYAASKFGLRGVAHSLRETLRPDRIAVTCLNLGTTATKEPRDVPSEEILSTYQGRKLPMEDVFQVVKCISNLSPASYIKEIDMPAMCEKGL